MDRRLLLALGLASAAAYLAGEWSDLRLLRLVSKPVPVLCLVAWAAAAPASSYARWVAAGLLLSVFGDVFLELRADLFLAGMMAFALGHLCYVAAYVGDTHRPCLGRALPYAAWGVATLLVLRPGLGPMTVPVAVYMAIITAMMWRAAARVGAAGAATAGQWAAALGALAYGVSDTLIAVDRFLTPLPWSAAPIILLYWAGQWGIAVSAKRP